MVDNTIAIATIASTILAAATWIADISFFSFGLLKTLTDLGGGLAVVQSQNHQHHGRRRESCGSGGSGDGTNLVASSHDANTT
jgi:hypothetical protein